MTIAGFCFNNKKMNPDFGFEYFQKFKNKIKKLSFSDFF